MGKVGRKECLEIEATMDNLGEKAHLDKGEPQEHQA